MKFDPALPEEGINVTPSHPLRELVVLLGGVIGVSVAVVVVLTVTIDSLVPLVPPHLEARWLSGWMGGMQELESDPRAAPVQELAERLAHHWPENPYSFRIGVIDDAQPNAFAVPGGWIGVTTGLLAQLESENELALVLGHEIGHFRNRDHLRGLGRGVALALVLGALGLADSGTAAGLATFAAGVTNRAFDRDQESDADLFGLALVHTEYGHVAGALEFFGRLPEPESAIERQMAHYLATHPMNDDRIDALVAAAQRAGWPFAGNLVPLEIDLDAGTEAGADAELEELEASPSPGADP